MAGIIFTRPPVRRTDSTTARINRRQLLAGSTALASTLALGTLGTLGSLAASGIATAQTPGATPLATPFASPGSTATAGGKLGALLAMVPDTESASNADDGVLFYYADLETQLKTLGIAQDGSLESADLVAALYPLALASQAFQYAMAPDFGETFGFTPYATHRTLFVGVPPREISIFEGGIDPDRLVAAWKASGYAPKMTDQGVEFWSAGENGEIDFSSPVSRYGVGALNNAVVLNDDTLVFARTSSLIRGVVAQVMGHGSSLADRPGVSPVVSTLSGRMVSAIGVTGRSATTVSRTMTRDERNALVALLAESDDMVGKMPSIDVMAFAVEAGAVGLVMDPGATPAAVSNDDSRDNSPSATPRVDQAAATTVAPLVEARMHAGSAADAAQAAKVVAWRWDHLDSPLVDRPYAELMTRVAAGVAPGDETVAAIDFDAGMHGAGSRWLQLVNNRDLVPFSE